MTLEKNTMNESFRKNILAKPIYWISICFITCLSFLFDLTNRTISIDDLARPHYGRDGKAMLAATRWGMQVWNDLLSYTEFTPFIDKYMGIFFFVLAAILFSRVFYAYFRESKHSLALCTIFSCLYISYPLINEIWNYNGANAVLAGNATLVSMSILILYNSTKFIIKRTLIATALLSIVVSSYEASAFMYVTAVLSILLLDYIIFNRSNWIQRGLQFAIPLIFAIVIRFVIGFELLKFYHLEYTPNGTTGIYWSLNNLSPQIKAVLDYTLQYYFVRGLIYLPIAVFVFALLCGTICTTVICIKKRNFIFALIYILICLSLFFQSMIQGNLMPYRTAQTIQYFTCVSLTMTGFALNCLKKKELAVIFFALTGYISYRQAAYLNKTLALNNQRSDNEAALVYDIGTRLQSFDTKKTVVFTGEISLGNNIDRQIKPNQKSLFGYLYRKIAIRMNWDYDKTEIYSTDVNSLLNWNIMSFDSQRQMKEYFSYYGFDIQTLDPMTWRIHNDYLKQAVDTVGELHPLDILDLGDLLLVYLGPDIITREDIE